MSLGTAVVALAAVAACKAQDPVVARAAGTEGPDDAMLAGDALVAGDVAPPTADVASRPADLIVEAFRGPPPALPLLSARSPRSTCPGGSA